MSSPPDQAPTSSAGVESTPSVVSSGYLLKLPDGPGDNLIRLLAERTRYDTQIPMHHIERLAIGSAVSHEGTYATFMRDWPATWKGSGPAIPVTKMSDEAVVPAKGLRAGRVILDWMLVPDAVMVLHPTLEAGMSEKRRRGETPSLELVIQGIGQTTHVFSIVTAVPYQDLQGLEGDTQHQTTFIGTDTSMDPWAPYFGPNGETSGTQDSELPVPEFMPRYVAVFPTVDPRPGTFVSEQQRLLISAPAINVGGRRVSLAGSAHAPLPLYLQAATREGSDVWDEGSRTEARAQAVAEAEGRPAWPFLAVKFDETCDDRGPGYHLTTL